MQIASDRKELGRCRSVKVAELSGTVKASFDKGPDITLARGDIFELPYGLLFKSVNVIAANGSSATILYGMVSFGGGGNGGTVPAISGSPEGVVSEIPGAMRYDATNGQLYIKDNGTGITGWVAYGP